MAGTRDSPGTQLKTGHGRHAAAVPARSPGPVTLAFKAAAFEPKRRLSRVALRTWPVIPVLCLLRPAARGLLPGYADQVLGFDAVLCLAACLAVTPVMTIARAPAAKLRWWYGNWVFVLGSAGLAVHLACPPGSMGDRAASDLVKWTGTAVIVLLLPMAVTSSAVAQKLLGPEWKRWQRAGVWAVWAVVVVHLALLHAWLATGAYLAVTLPAVIVRHPRARKSIKEWRAGGYSTGGWWAAVAVLGLVALTGLSALTGQEALAVARAVTLAP